MHVYHLHIHALTPSHIVRPILNTSISGHCDTRSRSTAPFVAPKLLPAQFTTPLPHVRRHSSRQCRKPGPVVKVHMVASKRGSHASQCVVSLWRWAAGMDTMRRRTHAQSQHTVSSLSSTCHNNSTVAHATACTLIVVTPHAPETRNSFNLGQVCRNTSGPVMPVTEGCLTQRTHATDTTPRKRPQSEPHHRKAQ